MPNLPTILFDLDGTLTDPSPGFLASLYYAMDGLNIERRPPEELTKYIGPPLRETMGSLLQTEDRDLIEEGVRLYRERLNEGGGKFEAKVIEGIPEVLEYFSQKGYVLYVCTGKPEGVAAEIVEHFGLSPFFRKVYGAKLDGRHCDKAELIQYIWEQEKIESPRGAMIGDTIFDILGAKANRLGTVGVRWGFGEEKDLVAAGADVMVSHAGELIPAIEKVI